MQPKLDDTRDSSFLSLFWLHMTTLEGNRVLTSPEGDVVVESVQANETPPANVRNKNASVRELWAWSQTLSPPPPVIKSTGEPAKGLNNLDAVWRISHDATLSIGELNVNYKPQTIFLDINFTASSDCLTHATDSFLPSLPASESDLNAITSQLSAQRIALIRPLTSANAPQLIARPYTLAYMLGQLIALNERNLQYATFNEKLEPPSLDYHLKGHTLGKESRMYIAPNNDSYFIKGPVHGNNIPNRHFGVFETIDAATLNGASLIGDTMYLYVPVEVSRLEAFRYFVVLLSSLYLRMTPQFIQSYFGNLKFIVPTHTENIDWDDSVVLSNRECAKALACFEAIVRNMFAGAEGLLWKYVIAGNAAFIRPHSCYSEGGVLRKAFRRVPTSRLCGIYLIDVANLGAEPEFVSHPHGGYALSILAYAEVMIIQAAMSVNGPPALIFTKEAAQIYASVERGGMFKNNYAVVVNPNADVKLAAHYSALLADENVRAELESAIHDFYPSNACEIYDMYTSICRTATATLSPFKKVSARTGVERRDVRRRRFEVGFIARFHDPEIAYRLGILANGTDPLQGAYTVNLALEVKRWLDGADLRNCKFLAALGDHIDEFYEIILDKPGRKGYYATVDGKLHRVDETSRVSDLLCWHNWGHLPRPYSSFIVDWGGFSVVPRPNLPESFHIIAMVTGGMIAPRAYKGPRCGRATHA